MTNRVSFEPTTMQVASCRDAGFALEQRDLPRPGRGELVLALRRAGLCGTDLWKLDRGLAKPGTVLGHEVVGTVAAAGAETTGFSPGDRVAVAHHVPCGTCDLCRQGSEPLCPEFAENLLVPGGFSEYILLRERAVSQATYGLPPELADEAAVFLEPAACVLRGVRRSGLTGGCAVVLGGGSMGLLHLLVLQAVLPAVRILVVEPLAERRELALRLGAAAAAAPGDEPARTLAELTRGARADALFDTVGGAGPFAQAFALTRPGGTVVLFAHAGRDDTAALDLNAFFKGERRLVATYSSAPAEQREAFRLLVTGRLDPRPLVTHRLPLARLAEAVELARSRRALKVLLTAEDRRP